MEDTTRETKDWWLLTLHYISKKTYITVEMKPENLHQENMDFQHEEKWEMKLCNTEARKKKKTCIIIMEKIKKLKLKE